MPPQPSSAEKMRSRALYALWLLAATGLLLELALRVLEPVDRDLATMLYLPGLERSYERVESLEELMQQTVLGWVPRRLRNGFVLNSRSSRTREYAEQYDPTRRRVVTLGDSFNFDSNGVPHDAMLSGVLESRLRAAGHGDVDVFGLGVPGVATRFQHRFFQLEKGLLRADVVVLVFFIGNDLTD
ncbi:MAG: hypothetical protein AAF725_19715, partial [Acidobacteriota bacterium]